MNIDDVKMDIHVLCMAAEDEAQPRAM